MKNIALISAIALSITAGSVIAAAPSNPSNNTSQAQGVSKKMGDCSCGSQCTANCEGKNQAKSSN